MKKDNYSANISWISNYLLNLIKHQSISVEELAKITGLSTATINAIYPNKKVSENTLEALLNNIHLSSLQYEKYVISDSKILIDEQRELVELSTFLNKTDLKVSLKVMLCSIGNFLESNDEKITYSEIENNLIAGLEYCYIFPKNDFNITEVPSPAKYDFLKLKKFILGRYPEVENKLDFIEMSNDTKDKNSVLKIYPYISLLNRIVIYSMKCESQVNVEQLILDVKKTFFSTLKQEKNILAHSTNMVKYEKLIDILILLNKIKKCWIYEKKYKAYFLARTEAWSKNGVYNSFWFQIAAQHATNIFTILNDFERDF